MNLTERCDDQAAPQGIPAGSLRVAALGWHSVFFVVHYGARFRVDPGMD